MFRTMLLVALAAFALAEPAAAQRRNVGVLPEVSRAIEGGRSVQVVVPQPELAANITPSNVAGAMGGGLIGAMIDSSVQANRAGRAEVGITPIRATLFDFDVDALAIGTTNAVTASLPWFNAQPAAFGRDASPFGKNAALDGSTAPQVAFFEYAYGVSPDFATVRVSVNVMVANKADPAVRRPEQRLQPRYLVYAQTLTSVMQLPSPTTPDENSVRWAANDGALMRQALTAAFGDLATLVPRALQFTDAEMQAAAAAPRNTDRAFPGSRVIEQNENGTLLLSGGLVHVQTLSQ